MHKMRPDREGNVRTPQHVTRDTLMSHLVTLALQSDMH